MQSLEQALIDFFQQAARRDASLLRALEHAQCFALAPDRWRFTLPELYSFLQQRAEIDIAVGYKRFRQAIYASPINKTVKQHGAEILIDQNQGHVDRSVYALVWRNPDDQDQPIGRNNPD